MRRSLKAAADAGIVLTTPSSALQKFRCGILRSANFHQLFAMLFQVTRSANGLEIAQTIVRFAGSATVSVLVMHRELLVVAATYASVTVAFQCLRSLSVEVDAFTAFSASFQLLWSLRQVPIALAALDAICVPCIVAVILQVAPSTETAGHVPHFRRFAFDAAFELGTPHPETPVRCKTFRSYTEQHLRTRPPFRVRPDSTSFRNSR